MKEESFIKLMLHPWCKRSEKYNLFYIRSIFFIKAFVFDVHLHLLLGMVYPRWTSNVIIYISLYISQWLKIKNSTVKLKYRRKCVNFEWFTLEEHLPTLKQELLPIHNDNNLNISDIFLDKTRYFLSFGLIVILGPNFLKFNVVLQKIIFYHFIKILKAIRNFKTNISIVLK